MQPVFKSKNPMGVPFGQALVEKGIITQSELDEALSVQRSRQDEYLGEILHSMGVSQEKINKALDCLSKRRKIGDILIDLGLITPESLERALKEQEKIQTSLGIRKPLGVLLLMMELISHKDYVRALSKHFVLPIISLEDRRIPPSLQVVLGKKYVREHQLLILENNEKTIKIALGEPTSSLMEEIRKSVPPHKEIIFYLAAPVEIESAQKRMFDPLLEKRIELKRQS
jgi:type IV pilus assembly protein PilB